MSTNSCPCTNQSKSSFTKTETVLPKEYNVIWQLSFYVQHVHHYAEYPIFQHKLIYGLCQTETLSHGCYSATEE